MGATFQASISALFFNTLLDVLLSSAKLQALQRFTVKDPLLERPDEPAEDPTSVRIGQVSALTIIVLNLAVILLSVLLFAVVVRLSIHTGVVPAGWHYCTVCCPSLYVQQGAVCRVLLQGLWA